MVRLFDFTCSLVGLALLSPLLLIVAAAIKLGDGGPVFFKQERVGRHGKPFKILKFRTMSVGSDRAGLPITVGQDARITSVGKWLRNWKLDELPQLINVLVGEMGLVGPRPEVPRYVALYTEEQAKVLALRPGVTDAASITYRAENDVLRRCEDPESFYVEHIMPNKIRINLEYAEEASWLNNLKVILATLGVLPPPVRVRQAGDLRAFDRIPFEAPVRLKAPDHPESEVRPVNISQGGLLLEPGAGIPVGSSCDLTIAPESRAPEGFPTEGVVIRSDDQGTVVRFSRPMSGKAFKAVEKPK